MKKFIFLTAGILICFSTFSQITRKAVALDNIENKFSVGDTLELHGASTSYEYKFEEPNKYIIGKGLDYEYVRKNQVRLINGKMPFWDSLWFYYASEEYFQERLISSYYSEYEKDLKQKLQEWSQADMLMEDEFQLDYLYSVLFKVFPGQLMKGDDLSLRIVIVKSDNAFMSSYCSGIIFISSEYLANLKSEKELIKGYSSQLASIILNKDIDEVRSQNDQIFINKLCTVIPDDYMKKVYPGLDTTTAQTFHRNISPALVYTAWKRYYNYNYKESLDLINRLEDFYLLTVDEYVLKSMLYRKLYNSPAKNLEAMVFLNKALEDSGGELIDLYFEQALIYLRLDNEELAAQSLQNYMDGITKLENLGYDMTEKKKQVRKYLMSLGMEGEL